MYTNPNKDIISWKADVDFVRKQQARSKGFVRNETCSKGYWETHDYTITTWYHRNYTANRAVAKDNSHVVSWYYINGEVHRW